MYGCIVLLYVCLSIYNFPFIILQESSVFSTKIVLIFHFRFPFLSSFRWYSVSCNKTSLSRFYFFFLFPSYSPFIFLLCVCFQTRKRKELFYLTTTVFKERKKELGAGVYKLCFTVAAYSGGFRVCVNRVASYPSPHFLIFIATFWI